VPTYEYKCTKDGSKFELWQEVGSEAPPCPTCGAESKKVFGPPRVHFKGSGFYLTDLRAEQSGGKSGEKAEAPAEAAPAAETKTEAKTESAPASTPAPAAPTAGSAGK
jgi:putative FmdB family regulatory protein